MWIWQALSGIALTILLLVHMIANHYVVEGGLRTYQDVIHYLSNPWIFGLETLFLIVVVSHALMGIRAVILDLGISARADTRLKYVLTALGILIIGYALILTGSLAFGA